MIKYLPDVFEQHVFERIQKYVEEVYQSKDGLKWDELFNRYSLHNPPPLRKFHYALEDEVSKYFGQKLKMSYCYLAMYGPNGKCIKHTDREQCQFTLDYCVSFDEPWPLFIEGQQFDLKENSAVLYKGTDHLHWREDRTSGQYCHMIFFHFVPEDFKGSLF